MRSILLLFYSSILFLSLHTSYGQLLSFNAWNQACSLLPYYRLQGTTFLHTALTHQELTQTTNYFKQTMVQLLHNPSTWQVSLGESDPDAPLCFYTQRLCVAPSATIGFQGDLHGDIHALRKYLLFLQAAGYLDAEDGFSITNKENFYLIFLGDYVDRGNYGAEVLYTLMRLKIANPHNVFLLRGNHEDSLLNERDGFLYECVTKFDLDTYQKLCSIYNLLPVALYISCGTQAHTDVLQCCHGGIEIGYNPQELLQAPEHIHYQELGMLYQASNYLDLNIPYQAGDRFLRDFMPEDCSTIGFLWNDFHVNPYADLIFDSRRGYIYGREITQKILEHQSVSGKYTLRGIFRAHQHSFADGRDDMMELLTLPQNYGADAQGVAKLWANTSNQTQGGLWHAIVCTFLVAPDSIYGKPRHTSPGFDYTAIGLLTTAEQFENWHFAVHRIPVVPSSNNNNNNNNTRPENN